MKNAEDVWIWVKEENRQTPSQDYVPVSPDYGPVSPDYDPYSPKQPSPLNLNEGIIGELFLWKGDPQPGRMWKVENIDIDRHEVELVPGTFEGTDRMKVPFVDIYKIEDKPPIQEIMLDNEEEKSVNNIPDTTPTGSGVDEESWEPSEQMKEKIKEKGLEEPFKKQQDENKEKGVESKNPTDPIVIRTPVLDIDASKSLPNLATIENKEEETDSG